MNRLGLAMGLGLCLAGIPGRGQPRPVLNPTRVRSVSGALPYGPLLCRGGLKVAVITSRPVPQELAQLQSRLAADVTGLDQDIESMDSAELNRKLARQDVVVRAGLTSSKGLAVDWVDLARQGQGLVTVHCGPMSPLPEGFEEDEEAQTWLLRGMAWNLLPALHRTAPSIRCLQGKGRIVAIAYPEGVNRSQPFCPSTAWIPNEPDWAYEEYVSLLCRSVLWAAGRIQTGRIDDAILEGDDLVVKGSWEERQVLSVGLKDLDGVEQAHWDEKCRPGQAIRISIAGMGLGPGVMEATLRSGRFRLDRVSLSIRRSGLEIVQAQWVAPKDESSSWAVDVALEGLIPAGCSLRARATDGHSREVSEVLLPWVEAQAGRMGLALPWWPVQTSFHALSLSLMDSQGRWLTGVSSPAYLPMAWPEGFFSVVDADVTREHPDRRKLLDWRRQGVAGVLLPIMTGDPEEQVESRLRAVSEAGLRPCIRIAPLYERGFTAFGHEMGRTPATQAEVQSMLERSSRHHPLFYLIEEPGFEGPPSAPYMTAEEFPAFRQFLKRRYGSLQRVNAAWGRTFRSWEDVAPPQNAVDASAGVLRDMADYFDGINASAVMKMAQWVAQADPGTPVLISLPEAFDMMPGCDWAGILPHLAGALVPGKMREASSARSQMASNGLLGVKVDGQQAGWEALIEGARFAVIEGDRWPSKSLVDLGQGAGRLFAGCLPTHDGVLIYRSADSLIQSLAHRQEESLLMSHEACAQLLEGMRMRYGYLTQEGLVAGLTRRIWMILLPQPQCISREEEFLLEAFCASGGVVVADILPQAQTEPVWTGDALGAERLFGAISSVADPQGEKKPGQTEQGAAMALEALEARSIVTSPSQSPAFQRSIGKGSAILLNRSFPSLLDAQEAPKEGEPLGVLMSLLPGDPWVHMAPRDAEIQSVRAFAYEGTGVEILGFSPSVSGTLRLSQRCYVYDALESKALGLASELNFIEFGSRGGRILVTYPYGVSGIRLEAPDRVQLGKKASWSALVLRDPEGASLSDHLCRVSLYPERSRPEDGVVERIKASAGSMEGDLLLGPGTPVGPWRMEVCEVASGQKASKRIRVEEN